MPYAGDDASRKAEELRQQGAAVAADLQAAETESRPYWKQLVTPFRVRTLLQEPDINGLLQPHCPDSTA